MAQQDSGGAGEAAVSGAARGRGSQRGGSAEPPAAPVRVRLDAPLDLAESLEPFRRSGDDLIDRWDGTRLLRVINVGGRWIAVRAEPVGDRESPGLDVTFEGPNTTAADRRTDASVARAVQGWFVVAPPEFADLVARDPVVAGLDRAHPGLRPVLQPDLFTALVRSISAQQVNLAWAATTRRRLAEAVGERHEIDGTAVFRLDPARIAGTSVAELRSLQFTTRKSESIVAVAEAVASGRIDPADLATQPDDEVIARLVALRRIGRWSAEWILARTFGRPRVVAGDLAVRKAVARAYLDVPIASEEETRAATRHWGAAAGIAQTLLLRSLVASPEYARGTETT
jgi:DNA-3-methyladenine glycosylase II